MKIGSETTVSIEELFQMVLFINNEIIEDDLKYYFFVFYELSY